MQREPDVLVIGGGIVGLFCAHFLRRRGMSVVVLERGGIGGPQSCSHGNTGFVGTTGSMPLAEPGVMAQGMRWLLRSDSPFHIRPRLDAGLASWFLQFRRACAPDRAAAGFRVLLEMKRRSLATFHELAREWAAVNGPEPLFRADGKLIVFNTRQGFDRACGSVERSVANGIPLRILTPAEVRQLEPGVRFDICGALLNEEDGHLVTPAFVQRLAGALDAAGVEVVAHAEVTGFEAANGRVRLVATSQGPFRPREVVVAAGVWSVALARGLGIPLLMEPAKGYSVTRSMPRNGPRLPVVLEEGKVAVAPLGDRLRYGGTLELAGMNATVSPRRVEGIERTVRTYLPDLEPADAPAEVWAGLRPCTPDGIPHLGRAPGWCNVLVACGHGHVGMGLAPASGELIAQIVAGETPAMDPAPFRLDRFARRRTVPAEAAA
jgi:D-amino-acid dehydrogenase